MTKIAKSCPAVIAVGRTKFGEHYGKEPEKLIEEAWLGASNEAGMERKALEACYLADCFLPITNKLGLEEGFLSELTELHVPMEATRSFNSALSAACHAIESGIYKTVLVGGIEKMTDRWDKIRDDLMLLEDPWSYFAGGTPEANHELMLRAYIRKYRISGENLEKLRVALANISVTNHLHALENEYAQFQKAITVDQVLKSRQASRKPLGLYDFAPISDGASALILTDQKTATKTTDNPIYVLGHSSATDYLNFPARVELAGFSSTRTATQNAMEKANLNPDDMQIVQLYDQSTVMEMISLEDLGFCQPGTAWKDIYSSCQDYQGYYELDGKKLSVNTNGGLKADGNPLGATGGAQIFEVYKQLRGEAKTRQVIGEPIYGCVHEFEGFGTKGYVCILGRKLE